MTLCLYGRIGFEQGVSMICCDTCGKEAATVARIVIDTAYDRSLSKPIYNCPECYRKKEQQRVEKQSEVRNGKSEV